MSDSSVPAPRKPEVNSSDQTRRQVKTSRTMVAQFSGPLPPPDLLQGYEDVCPGTAERILRAVEREAEHRREIENKIVAAQIEHGGRQFHEARLGQVFAFLITLGSIAAGVYTSIRGFQIAGSVIGVGGIGGIVTTFIVGRNRHRKSGDTDAPKEEHAPQKRLQNGNGKPRRKR